MGVLDAAAPADWAAQGDPPGDMENMKCAASARLMLRKQSGIVLSAAAVFIAYCQQPSGTDRLDGGSDELPNRVRPVVRQKFRVVFGLVAGVKSDKGAD
jgi:hypothetical protein